MQNTTGFLSMTGAEFLIHFGTTKESAVLKDVRKLYHSYKTRDGLLDGKKSIFYSMIFRVMTIMY